MLYSPIATSDCILFWVVLNQSDFLTFTRRPHETIHSGIIYRPPDNYLNGSAAAAVSRSTRCWSIAHSRLFIMNWMIIQKAFWGLLTLCFIDNLIVCCLPE